MKIKNNIMRVCLSFVATAVLYLLFCYLFEGGITGEQIIPSILSGLSVTAVQEYQRYRFK